MIIELEHFGKVVLCVHERINESSWCESNEEFLLQTTGLGRYWKSTEHYYIKNIYKHFGSMVLQYCREFPIGFPIASLSVYELCVSYCPKLTRRIWDGKCDTLL